MSASGATHAHVEARPGNGERASQERPFDESLLVSLLIASGMAAGLLVPGLARALAPALLPSLFVIVLASLTPFRSVLARALFALDRRAVVVVAWLQIALPLLVLASEAVLGVPRSLMPYVLISACSGAVFATPTLAGLFDLDRERAARIMILSTLLMPVSLCVFVGPLVGLDNVEAFSTFGQRVLVFLVLPALLVWTFRGVERATKASRKTALTIDRHASRLGMVGLAVFAVSIMDGVAEGAASDPGMMFALFMGALAVNLSMMMLTRFALLPIGYDIAQTASIVAMTRNVGLAYAMTSAFFGPELAKYVALCQVPLLVGPLFVRLRAKRSKAASIREPERQPA